MVMNDEAGIRAIEQRLGSMYPVRMYGPMVYEFMLSTPDYFTRDMIANAMYTSGYKRVSRLTAHNYISLIITYINAAALPHTITYHHEGKRYWYSVTIRDLTIHST